MMPRDFPAADPFSGDEDDLNEFTQNMASTDRSLNLVEPRNPRLRYHVQRYWKSQWPVQVCSMLCCLVVVSIIAVFASFLYIILKDLKNERITTDDGTEVRILGFWSLLVLSSLAGVLCCSFTWSLTYFDSFEPGMFPPTPLSPAKFRCVISVTRSLLGLVLSRSMGKSFRQITGHSFHLGYSMAILNGIVAAFTVIWYLI